MNYKLLAAFFISICLSSFTYAIDLGNESTADKADHFDFEDFHKDKGITIWEEKKETAAYESADTTSAAANTETPSTNQRATDSVKTYAKGDELKVREAYKIGNDPALRNIPSAYEATEKLYKQLNKFCQNGWVKTEEWHLPEKNYFYIHYRAVCL